MPEWMVELKGDPSDLEILCEHLGASDPSVEKEGDGRYWLKYSGLDALTNPDEVYERAVKLLGTISGITKFLGKFQAIEIAGLQRVEEDRPPTQFIFALGIPSSERFSLSEDTLIHLIGAANQNHALADAFYYFQKDDWTSLYKTWEILRDAVGGEHELLNRGWITRNGKKRFTLTIQHPEVLGDEARHARVKDPVPAKPMSIDEARTFVAGLIERYVEEFVQ